jgi:hypothetical protein
MSNATDKPKRTIRYVTYDRLFIVSANSMILAVMLGRFMRELLGEWGDVIPFGMSLVMFLIWGVISRRDTKFLGELTEHRERKVRFTEERKIHWKRWRSLSPTIEVLDDEQDQTPGDVES